MLVLCLTASMNYIKVPHRHWTNRVEHDEPSYMMCLPLDPEMIAASAPMPTMTAYGNLTQHSSHQQQQQRQLYYGDGSKHRAHNDSGSSTERRTKAKGRQGGRSVNHRSRRGSLSRRSSSRSKNKGREEPRSWSEALWSAAARFGGVLSAEDGEYEEDGDEEEDEESSDDDDASEDNYSETEEEDEDEDGEDDSSEDEDGFEPGVTLDALQERLAVRQVPFEKHLFLFFNYNTFFTFHYLTRRPDYAWFLHGRSCDVLSCSKMVCLFLGRQRACVRRAAHGDGQRRRMVHFRRPVARVREAG